MSEIGQVILHGRHTTSSTHSTFQEYRVSVKDACLPELYQLPRRSTLQLQGGHVQWPHPHLRYSGLGVPKLTFRLVIGGLLGERCGATMWSNKYN
jgi:hypothetical protein